LAIELLGGKGFSVDVARARRIADRLRDANAVLTPATLRAAYRLADFDVDVVVDAVAWLHDHQDLGEWTTRQLAVPGMHSKWLGTHGTLIDSLIGRNIKEEARPRLSVVHFTYTDPSYLASGARRHDAWTTGDNHVPAYQPRNVLIVENRDCRLWFPHMPDTIVVEGGGKAAAAILSQIDWILKAEQLVYWGDIDSDGFAILDNLRAELAPRGVRVDSILMDEAARTRYAHLGVNRDKRGDRLKPSTLRLPQLTSDEAECYAGVATAGTVRFRRIEQERMAMSDAETALLQVIAGQCRAETLSRLPNSGLNQMISAYASCIALGR
jgi:hypothetical protein